MKPLENAGCFNRTFIELKLERRVSLHGASHCFNRTFMELKLSINRMRHRAAKF